MVAMIKTSPMLPVPAIRCLKEVKLLNNPVTSLKKRGLRPGFAGPLFLICRRMYYTNANV